MSKEKKKIDRVVPAEKLSDPKVQKDLHEVLMKLTALVVTDRSCLAREGVAILRKYVK